MKREKIEIARTVVNDTKQKKFLNFIDLYIILYKIEDLFLYDFLEKFLLYSLFTGDLVFSL